MDNQYEDEYVCKVSKNRRKETDRIYNEQYNARLYRETS